MKNRNFKKKPMVKMNLTIEPEFFKLLKEHANNDYTRVSTWTKQFLMKQLLPKNENWLKQYPNQTTVGIIAGRVSPNIESIDIDVKNDCNNCFTNNGNMQ